MSEQSLRDALEKLPSTWDAVPMHVVRELLAAHPVEPAGVSDEAVEALYWIDNALRNGTKMTRANLAFEVLCNQLGVDPESLTSSDAVLDRLRSNLLGGVK